MNDKIYGNYAKLTLSSTSMIPHQILNTKESPISCSRRLTNSSSSQFHQQLYKQLYTFYHSKIELKPQTIKHISQKRNL